MKNAIIESVWNVTRDFKVTDLLYLLPVLAAVGAALGYFFFRSKNQTAYCAFDSNSTIHEDTYSTRVSVTEPAGETANAETVASSQAVKELEPVVPKKPETSSPAEEPTAPEVSEETDTTEDAVPEEITESDETPETVQEMSAIDSVEEVAVEPETADPAETNVETETAAEADAAAEPETSDETESGLLSIMDIVTATGVTESRVRKSIKAAGIEAVQQIRNDKGRLIKVYDFETVRKVLEDAGHLNAAETVQDTPSEKAVITEDTILSIMEIVKETGVSESCVRKDIKAAELSPSAELNIGKNRIVKGYRFGDVKQILLKKNRVAA